MGYNCSPPIKKGPMGPRLYVRIRGLESERFRVSGFRVYGRILSHSATFEQLSIENELEF